MKILHIIFSFTTGGTETMLVDIVNEQCKTNEVVLIVVNSSFSENLIKRVDPKITIHRINRKPGSRNPLKIFQINYIIFKLKPDIIHCHNHNMVGLLKAKAGAPVCLTVHDVNIATDHFTKYDRLFAISNAVKKDISVRSQLTSELIFNGIDFTTIIPRQAFSPSPTFRMVQISRLDHEKKGQHLLLQAVSYLVHEKGFSNLEVDLIGEGPSATYLQELTKQLKIEAQVQFMGMRDRSFIYAHLKNYHLLVQPSIYEGFGLTVVEGMAARIPVLVSNIDGPMEIINKGDFGYFFEHKNVESLATAIQTIMNKYKEGEIEPLSKKAFNYANTHFNIQTTAKNYIEQYQALV
jgi:glycosyltransferase involved in cell wall biosynthesis